MGKSLSPPRLLQNPPAIRCVPVEPCAYHRPRCILAQVERSPMTAPHMALPMFWLVFSCGIVGGVALAHEPGPADRRADEMRPTLTGMVLMPDGSPAPEATVQWT